MEIFFTWILSRDRPKGKEGLKYERPVDPQYLPPQYECSKGDVRPLEEDNAISADLIIHHEQFEWWGLQRY
ncbi:piezo-type mechanosensitive ion channel-like protein isoform X1 [Sesbania bispinosa]|nr:piezo-type mechanosensitive ion channel-like protein isoform X1 [Sesbania bispinosa]